MLVRFSMLVLQLIISTNGLYKDDFCNGFNYVDFDENLIEAEHLSTTYDKDIRLSIYTLAGEFNTRGLTVSYEKDLRTSYRLNTLKVCCYISDLTIGYVVQRENDNTLIYKTRNGCYKVVYGYSDMIGAYIADKTYILCSATEICKPSTISNPIYVPQALKTSDFSVGTPYSTSYSGSRSNSPSTSFSVGTYPPPSPVLKPTVYPSPWIKPVVYPSPSTKPVTYPSMAVSSDLLRVGSDEFCKKSINYLDLDGFANIGTYLDQDTWGRFQLTLYRTPPTGMYGFTILDVKYRPTDIYSGREMIALSKYRVCCNIYSISTLSDVARVLPSTNTFVFKIQNTGYEYDMCKSIWYAYVTTSLYSTVKDITAVESVSSCRTTFFCAY